MHLSEACARTQAPMRQPAFRGRPSGLVTHRARKVATKGFSMSGLHPQVCQAHLAARSLHHSRQACMGRVGCGRVNRCQR